MKEEDPARTPTAPDGPEERADAMEDRDGMGEKRAGETGDRTALNLKPPKIQVPSPSPSQDPPPSA